uniref:Transposase n=1 Tax=Salmonella phage PMBT19 TaxID=3229743 RepID=A0AB39C164_9CAUD
MDKARAFRVTLYKMDGRSRVAVATVRANAMLNVLLKSFI